MTFPVSEILSSKNKRVVANVTDVILTHLNVVCHDIEPLLSSV